MANLTGKTLGRYQIMELLGRGGMAEVYKAYHTTLDRHVAIKILHPALLSDPQHRERFAREAQAVARLDHPNIVRVFDFDTIDDLSFMVIQYVEGPNLRTVLQAHGEAGAPLAYETVEEIITRIASALAYAHGRGMLHRDVKPANILFTAEERPMLTDFGIAKVLNSISLTSTGGILGTAAYMSPEQSQGPSVDRRSDLYSLGVVLYEMLTGRVPFEADTPLNVVFKHINEPLPPPRRLNPHLPAALEHLVLRALAKDPADRFQTADEMIQATREAVAQARLVYALAAPATPAAEAPADRPPTGPAAQPADDHTLNAGDDEDTITIRLDSPEVLIEAGGPPVVTTAEISNPSQTTEQVQYNFELTALDPGWYRLDPKSVLLQRGDSSEVRITFAVPRRGGQLGIFAYRLRARAKHNPRISGITTGRLRVSSPPTLQMAVDPPSAGGQEARYTVQLVNSPVSTLVVEVTGKDPAGVLAFTATPPRVRLAPNEAGAVEVGVAIQPGVVGEARSYPFTLVANLTGDDQTNMPIECSAEFIHVPAVQLALRLELESSEGPASYYRIVLENPTSLTLDVDLRASDPQNALDFFFHENRDQLRLQRQETSSSKLFARVVQTAPLTTPQTYPFTLRAQVRNADGPGDITQVVEGTLVHETPPAPPPQHPIEKLWLALVPRQAEGAARFTLQAENRGQEPVRLAVRGEDDAGALEFTFAPPQVTLAPQSSAPISLLVRRAAAAPGGPDAYPFQVVGWLPDLDDGRTLTCSGAWSPGPQGPLFDAALVPVAPEGPEGSYQVRLINGSAGPLSVILSGRDKRGLLAFTFEATRVTLPPSSEKMVPCTVRPNALEPLSEGHAYPFEVVCWGPGVPGRTLRGELLYVSF